MMHPMPLIRDRLVPRVRSDQDYIYLKEQDLTES
jgi:hypothetical protein